MGLVLMLAQSPSVAQSSRRGHTNASSTQARQSSTSRPEPKAGDPNIVAALQQVSADRIRATIEKLVGFGTRLSITPADPQSIASGRGVGAAREWIKAQFESYAQACGGCLEVKTEAYTQEPAPRVPKPTEIVDVYAVQRGSDPENAKRIYLVTGHYDSRPSNDQDTQADAPGANDDASGTAVSLECARVLSKYKFPATIIYLTVAGEEQGLLGSKQFAKMAREQGWDLGAVLNNDIVGGDKSPGQNPDIVRVFSEGIPAPAVGNEAEVRQIRAIGAENDSPSRELARYIREVAKQYLHGDFGPMMVFRPDRYLRGGDHTSFNQQGFSAVRITEYRENYQHQHQNVRTENGIEYGDVLKFVDFQYTANVARLNAATLAALASAPAPPANVRLETRKLENPSTLMWDEAAGGMAAGYEVVWRATTSPEWEGVQNVGKVTSFTSELSKDNVVFAVRAVDAGGHRSVAILPRPERR